MVEQKNISFCLNELFLRDLNTDKKNAFALSLIIKAHFANSRVYNYNALSLSKKINVSRYMIAKYIPVIRLSGWGYYTSTEFVVKSFRDIVRHRRLKKFKIELSSADTIDSVVDKLNMIILTNNLSNQDKVSTARGYYVESCSREQSLKEYRKIKKKGFDPKRFSGAFTEDTIIGMRRLSELLNVSIFSASKFVKRMSAAKKIKTEEVTELVMRKVSTAEYISDFGYYFVSRNNLYRHLGTKVTILYV